MLTQTEQFYAQVKKEALGLTRAQASSEPTWSPSSRSFTPKNSVLQDEADALHIFYCVCARQVTGHLSIVKCKACAQESVWWPELSQQINNMVLKCRTSIQEHHNPKEPLLPKECPQRPWQKLGADLFMLEGKTYLLVVDYFSRYIGISLLCGTRSTDAIIHLKSIFACHGIRGILMSDKGPPFSGQAFSSFAAS